METENVEEAKKNSIEVTKATKLFKKKDKIEGVGRWLSGKVLAAHLLGPKLGFPAST